MRLKAIFLSLLMVLMAVPAHADTITIPNTFSAGTSAQASQVNANFTAVTTVVNGNLDNSNIKSAAGIVPSKLSLISEYMNLQSTNNRGFSAGVTGDTVPRVALNSRGSLDFGPGTSTAMDLALIRGDSNTVKLRDQGDTADKNFTCGALSFSDTSAGTALLQVLRTTNNNCVAAGVTGDANPRVALNSRGSLDFGGGSGSLDLAITREDSNTVAVRDQGNSTYKNLKVGVLTPSTAITVPSGGTGISSCTTGDIPVGNGSNTMTMLTKGSNGTFLGVSGGTVGYYAPSGGLFKASSISSTARTLPTSGALSGTYIHSGDVTSTSTYTFAHGTRIYLKGNLTIGHTMTGTAQSNGGVGGVYGYSNHGGGLGGGNGPVYQSGGGSGAAGEGAGGTGGQGTTGYTNTQGAVYTTLGVGGSGGGPGSGNGTSPSTGGNGGGGGAFLYIEVDGDVTLNETVAANGSNGSAGSGTNPGGGGGGSGGQIVIRCTGNFTLASAKSVTCNGGNGAAQNGSGCKGGGGGGGSVQVWSGGSATVTGSLTCAGGSKGTGTAPTQDAADGSSGTTETIQNTTPVSLFILNTIPLRPINNVIKFEIKKDLGKCG